MRRRPVLLALAGVLTLAGKPAAAFQVKDPYATSLSYDSISIDRLWAFGDSYTRANRKAFPNWAEQMRADLEVGTLKDYAVSGATAGVYSGSTNNLTTQVNRLRNAAPTFHSRDLTVVYMGYNDIDGNTKNAAGTDLANAKSNYKTQLGRIVATDGGATSSNRRILVVMVHNWGRVPYYVQNGGSDVMRSRTQVWDSFVAQTAAAKPNVIAVDLYDALEYVFNHPAKYGFTNITTPDPNNSATTAFWDDWFHPGEHGQFMIRQVFEYYLTVGWDWSNQTKTPADAKAKLLADLGAGKVFTRPYGTASAQAQPQTQAPTQGGTGAAPPAAVKVPSLPELEAAPEHFGVVWATARGRKGG
jgi:phospholipase/lecithinase/hemolysin